jgi:hypothetical protein
MAFYPVRAEKPPAEKHPLLPPIASRAQELARAFAAGRYGGRELSDGELVGSSEAWKNVRGGLMGRALRRLALLGRA